mgnify:CR=1 FL=1
MRVAILILNYNGRDLLAECLPSVLHAAGNSSHVCEVVIIDNDSSDDSCEYLAANFSNVKVIAKPNRGLCSFNDVIEAENSRAYDIALLLNNDIKLHANAVDPLVEPFEEQLRQPDVAAPVFLTAPLCWQFDGVTCEGFKSAVGWRWGLVQATGRFPGHQQVLRIPGETACAGAALAVDCRLFRELGGFDSLFLPGRLEDLDLAFRAWQRGWKLRYVPAAIAYHKGQVSFAREFGRSGCDQLALRNTLLFQRKNIRHPINVLRQFFGHALRAARDIVLAPVAAKEARWPFLRAWTEARKVWREHQGSGGAAAHQYSLTYRQQIKSERDFFRRFTASRLLSESRGQPVEYAIMPDPALDAVQGLGPAASLIGKRGDIANNRAEDFRD